MLACARVGKTNNPFTSYVIQLTLHLERRGEVYGQPIQQVRSITFKGSCWICGVFFNAIIKPYAIAEKVTYIAPNCDFYLVQAQSIAWVQPEHFP